MAPGCQISAVAKVALPNDRPAFDRCAEIARLADGTMLAHSRLALRLRFDIAMDAGTVNPDNHISVRDWHRNRVWEERP